MYIDILTNFATCRHNNSVYEQRWLNGFTASLFLSDEGPMLETLDYTIRIGSTPTILYFDLSHSLRNFVNKITFDVMVKVICNYLLKHPKLELSFI